MSHLRAYEFQTISGVVVDKAEHDQYGKLLSVLDSKIESVTYPKQYLTVKAAFERDDSMLVAVNIPRKCNKCVDALGECLVPVVGNAVRGTVVRDGTPLHSCLRCGVLKVPCSLRVGTKTGRRGRWVLPESEIDQALNSLGLCGKLIKDLLYTDYYPEQEVVLARLRGLAFVAQRIKEAKSPRYTTLREPSGTTEKQMSALWQDLVATTGVSLQAETSIAREAVSPATRFVTGGTAARSLSTTSRVNVTSDFALGGTAGASGTTRSGHVLTPAEPRSRSASSTPLSDVLEQARQTRAEKRRRVDEDGDAEGAEAEMQMGD